MEAATTLRFPHVGVQSDRLIVDGLIVDDPTAVAFVRQRVAGGSDAQSVVRDAIEVGARVLHREHTGAAADFVRAEFEKASAAVEREFAERARSTGEALEAAFARHFSDDSSGAVQHKVREAVGEVTARMREDLVKSFSAADANNPLAQFQRHVLVAMKQGSEQQDRHLRAMTERLQALQLEVTKLQAEREKLAEVAAEADRGTAKGRTFEEAVADALDRIALAQGDLAEAVGDLKGTTRRTGDVVVDLEACRGPARGRIVFEAKTGRLSQRGAIEELDRAKAERGADYAVLVVPNEDRVPARMQTLREVNGDKLVVCFDPEDGSTLSLEVAYALARARVLMSRGEADGIDAAAVRDLVERATGALGETQRIKQQLTGATTSIEKAREIVDHLATQVRGYLGQIEGLLDAAEGDPMPLGADAERR